MRSFLIKIPENRQDLDHHGVLTAEAYNTGFQLQSNVAFMVMGMGSTFYVQGKVAVAVATSSSTRSTFYVQL